MHPRTAAIQQARREFLTTFAGGAGGLALLSLLKDDGLLAAIAAPAAVSTDPLAPRPPHFAPKAKACIFIFLEGAPSQIDLFDPKPKLNELHGQKLPESMTKNVRFAFIQKETAVLMGSPRKFAKHGQCGMELSDLLPHLATCADDIALVRSMHTEAFNHHPGQLMMNTGVPHVRPAEHGLVAQLRPGQRVAEPARLRRAHRRPRHQRRGVELVERLPAVDRTRACCSATRASRCSNLNNPAGLSRQMQREEPRRAGAAQPPAATRRSAIPKSPAASPPTSWPSACRRPRRS